MQTRWEEKTLHGRYPAGIKEADVDMKATNQSPLVSRPIKKDSSQLHKTKPSSQKRTHRHIMMTQIHNAACATNMRKLLTTLSRVAQS